MSSAWMEHNVHGSLLTGAQLCEQTHSAIARMSEGAAVANEALRSEVFNKISVGNLKSEYMFDTDSV